MIYPKCIDAVGGKPVVANGDITNVEEVRLLRGFGVSGVMIGRAAIRDPSIFYMLKNELGFRKPKRPLQGIVKLMDEYSVLSEDIGSQEYSARFMKVIGRSRDIMH